MNSKEDIKSLKKGEDVVDLLCPTRTKDMLPQENSVQVEEIIDTEQFSALTKVSVHFIFFTKSVN